MANESKIYFNIYFFEFIIIKYLNFFQDLYKQFSKISIKSLILIFNKKILNFENS